MPQWRHKIELNAVIAELNAEFDLSDQERYCPVKVRKALAAEVEKAPALAHFGRRLREAKKVAEVNRCLAAVFDAADREGVWCGLASRETSRPEAPANG